MENHKKRVAGPALLPDLSTVVQRTARRVVELREDQGAVAEAGALPRTGFPDQKKRDVRLGCCNDPSGKILFSF